MSEKFTKGPWKTEREGIHALILGGDATIVAVRHRLPADVHEANARRIVACVNACEGISTDNLEDNRAVAWLAQRYNEVVQQRDELLKALTFYAEGSHFIQHDPEAWDTVSGEPQNFREDEANTATVEDGSVARAAIAKATGEKA